MIIIVSCISYLSYIKPQLIRKQVLTQYRCISYLSYIKPQPEIVRSFISCVVYLIFPTSNRNSLLEKRITLVLYILSFLHQTATYANSSQEGSSCISYLSYIKPQPLRLTEYL